MRGRLPQGVGANFCSLRGVSLREASLGEAPLREDSLWPCCCWVCLGFFVSSWFPSDESMVTTGSAGLILDGSRKETARLVPGNGVSSIRQWVVWKSLKIGGFILGWRRLVRLFGRGARGGGWIQVGCRPCGRCADGWRSDAGPAGGALTDAGRMQGGWRSDGGRMQAGSAMNP